MPMQFCFPDKEGVLQCHDIPILIVTFPPVGPPDPGPRFLDDLSRLATITELSKQIANREVLAGITEGLNVALKAAQAAAPKGSKVHLNEKNYSAA